MSRVREVQLSAVPARAEVLRLLGHREGKTRLEAPLSRLVDATMAGEAASARCNAAMCEMAVPAEWAGVFRGAERLAAGIVTMGESIEQKIEALVAARALTDALVLDAYASAVVEAAAVQLNRQFCADADGRGLVAGRRLSPGHSHWPLENQKMLFSLFDGRTAGVTLNEFFVMSPRKSISFAVPLGRTLAPGDPELGCRTCAMANCEYRRHPRVEPEED
jgi:hypothetical protein